MIIHSIYSRLDVLIEDVIPDLISELEEKRDEIESRAEERERNLTEKEENRIEFLDNQIEVLNDAIYSLQEIRDQIEGADNA